MRPNQEPTPTSSSAAQEFCRQLTRQHSKTFYFGSCFFTPEQRRAVWAVYAACRTGDDAVDEPGQHDPRERLAWWWDHLRRAYHGEPQGEPVFEALRLAVQRYPIPLAAFEELHEGLQMDLSPRQYRTLGELELYCRRVAGVVGLMIAPIAGYSGGASTLQRAARLGQAMQLTNILRDVGEDARRGRLYLPLELLDRHGVRPRDVLGGRLTPQYGDVIRELVRLNREWYREGRQGIPRLHGPSRLAVGAAASAYEGILDSLESNRFDNFSRRAEVSGTRKLLMLPRVLWQASVARA